MADKLITPQVDYNYWLKRLNTQLIVSTNENSLVSKVVKPTNKKTLLLSINSPLSLLSMLLYSACYADCAECLTIWCYSFRKITGCLSVA